jgi:tetratricopeptide (TPR) repeat protein
VGLIIAKKDGRRAEAEAEIDAALAIDPLLTAAHINRGDLLKEKGDIAGSVAAYEKAVEPLLKKQTLNIDEVAAFYVLATAYEGQGRGDDALAQYETAASKAPHLAEPQYNVALQYEKLLMVDKAIAAYRRAVELNPHEPDAHYHLAGLLAEQGKLPEALAELEAVLAINPTYPNAAGHAARIRQLIR